MLLICAFIRSYSFTKIHANFSIDSYPNNDMASPILLDLYIWFDPIYTNHQFWCNDLIPQCCWCLCQDTPENSKDEVIFVLGYFAFFMWNWLTFLQYSKISTLSCLHVALWSKSVTHFPSALTYWLWKRRLRLSPCFSGQIMATIGSWCWVGFPG